MIRRCARGARWREFAGLVRHVLHPRRIGSLFGRWGAWSLFLEGRERRKCSHWPIRPTARRRSNCGKSAGGASLATALHAVDANGAVVAFGNSSGEMTSISFADFRGGQNARLQSFFSFTSGPEEQFAPDLALLVSLVADKSLTPQTGPERNWRDIARVANELRDRRVGGKAVFRVEP